MEISILEEKFIQNLSQPHSISNAVQKPTVYCGCQAPCNETGMGMQQRGKEKYDMKWYCVILLLLFAWQLHAENKPLVLQEMSWLEVQNYLKTSDMVIMSLGSTEQHGPHLPLGIDYFEALELSKMVSQKTGVLVAPIVIIGYSEYHSGFPGTLSLKPETMAQALNENIDMLLKYGFRRFMFLIIMAAIPWWRIL
jgi:Creatinine amidohydrolase